MRGRRRRGCVLGWCAIVMGAVILLSMVLPAGFWWLAAGVGLIVFGIYCNGRPC